MPKVIHHVTDSIQALMPVALSITMTVEPAEPTHYQLVEVTIKLLVHVEDFQNLRPMDNTYILTKTERDRENTRV